MADDAAWMGVVAHLTIGHGRAGEAIDFYHAAFAAALVGEVHKADDGRRVMHAHLSVNGGPLMLNDDFPEHTGGVGVPAAVTLHLQVDDPDAWFDRATAAGALVRKPLEDQFWGDRYGQVEDPFGHRWSIGGPAKGG